MGAFESRHWSVTDFRIDEAEHVDGTGTVVIAVHGDTDRHVADELQVRLAEAIADRPSVLVLDFSGVTFLDSMALGVLLKSLKRLGQLGGRMRVVAPRAEIRRIFEVTLLDRLFDLDSSRDEAISATASPA